MILVDGVLGNRHQDPRLAERCTTAEREGRLETLQLPLLVAQRRRLRVVSDAGTEIGVSVGEGTQLRDGDVLVDEEGGRVVVVSLETAQVVSFRFEPSLATDTAFRSGVQLGHLLGMQHWHFRWADGLCTVQVTDHVFMEAVLRAHPVEGVSYEFSSLDTATGGVT
jgi:urease accessory protein